MIPEIVVSNIRIGKMNNSFEIIEDENNRDYLLDTDKISKMSGKKLHHKRKLLHHFIKKHAYTVQIQPLTAETVRKDLMQVFFQWEKERDKTRTETRNELTAFRRLLRAWRHFSVKVLTISVDGSICGFTIFEHVRPDYAVSAFQKGAVSKKGIYEVLNWEMAKYLNIKGCKYINIEQDLGISGLRRAKQDYNPTYFKKYIIKPNTRSV